MDALTMLPLIAQSDGSGAIAAIIGLFMTLVWLVVMVAMIAGMWKTFAKAGEPGWAAIIPIYNILILVKIARKEVWWVVFFFLPLLNLVGLIVICMEVAKHFGKGAGFGIGMAFLPPIFWPLLGFSNAQYQGTPAFA